MANLNPINPYAVWDEARDLIQKNKDNIIQLFGELNNLDTQAQFDEVNKLIGNYAIDDNIGVLDPNVSVIANLVIIKNNLTAEILRLNKAEASINDLQARVKKIEDDGIGGYLGTFSGADGDDISNLPVLANDEERVITEFSAGQGQEIFYQEWNWKNAQWNKLGGVLNSHIHSQSDGISLVDVAAQQDPKIAAAKAEAIAAALAAAKAQDLLVEAAALAAAKAEDVKTLARAEAFATNADKKVLTDAAKAATDADLLVEAAALAAAKAEDVKNLALAKLYTDEQIAKVNGITPADVAAQQDPKIAKAKAEAIAESELYHRNNNPLLKYYELIHTFPSKSSTYQLDKTKPNDYIAMWRKDGNSPDSELTQEFSILEINSKIGFELDGYSLFRISITAAGLMTLQETQDAHPVTLFRRKEA